MATLMNTLADVRDRIDQYSKKDLNEQNTKATLIEPVMRALGWDTEDVEEVAREFKVKSRDKPVDYGLLQLRKPRLFVEAKALGKDLADRRWANQIMGYAAVAGVEWIVLTDGNEWRIYNTHAPVAVDEKLFRTVRLTDDGVDQVAQTLELLSKARLEESRIDVLWRAQFIDRHVQEALEQVFSPDNDMLLVNFVAGRTKDLSVEDIRDSLRRCNVTLEFPPLTDVPAHAPPQSAPRTSVPSGPKQSHETSIADLLKAGVIQPGCELRKSYKGAKLTARIERDGRVNFAGKLYSSPSQAAGAARVSVIGMPSDGKLPATNGWEFWTVVGGSGKSVRLAALRDRIDQAGQAGAAS
jgi:RAMA domain-containing protein